MKINTKKDSLDKNQIEIKSFMFDWGIVFLLML